MAGMKSQIEEHPAIVFLGALLVGFLAGLSTYQGTLTYTNRVVVARSDVLTAELQQEMSKDARALDAARDLSSYSQEQLDLLANATTIRETIADLNRAITTSDVACKSNPSQCIARDDRIQDREKEDAGLKQIEARHSTVEQLLLNAADSLCGR